MSRTVQQAPGLWRTDLQRHDLGVPRREAIQNRVAIAWEAPFIKHAHPGKEIIHVPKDHWNIRSGARRQRRWKLATSCSSRWERSTR